MDSQAKARFCGDSDGSRSTGSDPTLAPLIVDLDGTLTATDTLIESIVGLFKRNPLVALTGLFRLAKGRAAFKEYFASKVDLSVERLPYRMPVLAFLHTEKAKGRRLILATSAHQKIAAAVAIHLGVFDDVLASDGAHNLKGAAKLEAITTRVGDRFVYAGDSEADLPIWKVAKAAVLVGVSPRVAETVRHCVPIERDFPRESVPVAAWLRALRVHQWAKNLLLFVPSLTAFSILRGDQARDLVVAFFSFCLAASATYIVNDVWDLDSDRAHPRKRNRPIASAQVPVVQAMTMASGALAIALILAATVSRDFIGMMILYLALTSAYSLVLKEYTVLDVLTLSLLYTLRVLAGSVVVAITTSSWLLAFSMFIFFSLALVKRCAELVSLGQSGRDAPHGRDYRIDDLVVLWPLGVGSALCAVVVFGLFISAAETQARYASPRLLWFVAIGLIYWLSRMWIKSARGEMHDDPLVFAVQDLGSRMTMLITISLTLVAHFIDIGLP